ncbi:SoxR reducing system RseC family protein [Sansalvadorimonas verongulae]|uniref:SoxR reducing system RseC family protein n=1 Tax=Sansalvadorimonas verongulae TaxID=2172824 RepID=UPI0012BC09DF|nr:SoxR reducing system RseC family protein [Sansalvadorimonas verongulae]MTI14112.1 transcriptional regulator [Sansalvadorimonas verongulae]
MIEERGRIVKVDDGFVWVETLRKSTCGSCQAKNSCGEGILNRLKPFRNHAYIRASNRYPVAEGDEVTIALPEEAVVSASLLVYLFPLLLLLSGAVIGAGLELAEPLVIVLSLTGLLSGFGLVRWWTAREKTEGQYQPQVLRWHVPLAASENP